jgi:hypothetical protein
MVSRMGASATAGAVVSFLLAGVASAAGAVQQGPVPPEVTAQVPSVVVLGADEDAAPVDSTLVEMPVVVPDAVADVAASAVDGAAVAPEDVAALPEVAEALEDDDVVAAAEVLEADRVATEVVETPDVQTIGVTWPADVDGEAIAPQVRVMTDGEWSDWHEIGEDAEQPDAGTADAANATARGGTEAVWIGDAEAVQLSFATTAAQAEDINLVLVGSEEVPLQTGDGLVGEVEVDATSASLATGTLAAAAPTIAVISRAAWGARDQVCTPDVAGQLVGAVVHHTAGSNSYSTQAQAMQQIRNDQRYHIEGRKWCDLGYNFVVDKWGNIYEGRANSLTQPVIGVHAGGFNTGTVGVSMLGTYDAAPSAQTQRAVGQIIGYRLGAYGVNPQGTMTYWTGEGENSKFRNQNVTLPRVFGHRDVAYTACPGNGGYAVLPNIRAIADSYSYDQRFVEARAVVRAMYEDILGRGVDPSGLNTWSNMLVSGSGLPALVASLTSSDEYIRLRVREAYSDVLGRAAEPAGLEHWTRTIKAGAATVDDVERRFLSSQEFWSKSGGSDEGYVRRMYTSVLGRTASAAEVQHWVAEIRRLGREAVTDGIWFSMEAAKHRAGVYYSTYLKRTPDAGGLQTWGQVLLQQGEGAVRIGIAGSEEYRVKAIGRFPR